MIKKEFLGWFCFAVTFILLVWLILLNCWGLTIIGDVVDHGSFGTWGQTASAIGTTVAFLIGLWNLYYSRSQYNAGEQRRKEEEETSVFFWLIPIEDRDETTDEHIGWQWTINILNATKSPIYNWSISFESDENHLCNFQKNPLLPGANPFNLPFFDEVEPSKSPFAKIIFESKSGIFWSRSVKGELVKVTGNEITCIHSL